MFSFFKDSKRAKEADLLQKELALNRKLISLDMEKLLLIELLDDDPNDPENLKELKTHMRNYFHLLKEAREAINELYGHC
ncbi:MAG: hypothetical protein LBV43_01680 [Prevotella sp.]|jgi:hypothetical protein|nr:hypothetical protein [Prevotella sp.]